ncbi:MAG: GNAT family N-acetyltransferase [Candidatus Dormibacteraeota bacterium]|nr:GNAT family N-acetyltransferase [Candidatus Dormibacteraeota bacterium]
MSSALERQSGGAAPLVRPLRSPDLPEVGSMLARAFLPDPTSAWLFPKPAGRPQALARWYRLNASLLLASGEGWVTDDLSAAALWLPMGRVPERPSGHARTWDVVSVNLQVMRMLGPRVARAAMTTLRLHRLHGVTPAWYLAILGTEPSRQGTGLGTAVLAPMLARCDRTGTPAVLDTATLVDVRFYQGRGFEVVGEVQSPHGPHFWAMRRQPARS